MPPNLFLYWATPCTQVQLCVFSISFLLFVFSLVEILISLPIPFLSLDVYIRTNILLFYATSFFFLAVVGIVAISSRILWMRYLNHRLLGISTIRFETNKWSCWTPDIFQAKKRKKYWVFSWKLTARVGEVFSTMLYMWTDIFGAEKKLRMVGPIWGGVTFVKQAWWRLKLSEMENGVACLTTNHWYWFVSYYTLSYDYLNILHVVRLQFLRHWRGQVDYNVLMKGTRAEF